MQAATADLVQTELRRAGVRVQRMDDYSGKLMSGAGTVGLIIPSLAYFRDAVAAVAQRLRQTDPAAADQFIGEVASVSSDEFALGVIVY